MTDYLTRQEVAALLKVSVRTVNTWRKSGKLKGLKLSHRVVRFAREDVERFLSANTSKCPTCGDKGQIPECLEPGIYYGVPCPDCCDGPPD